MVGSERSLDVILGKNTIAEFSLRNDQLVWRYNPMWRVSGYPISPHLPLQDDIPSLNVQRYLSNLLPEGKAFDELMASFHLSKTNTFGLIQALGLDVSGSLIFLPSGQAFPKEKKFKKILLEELERRLDDRHDFSLIIWDGKPRLSVAGVQDKINVILDEKGELGFGEGTLCSTHILKFEMQKLAHIALNEYITMRLARACGLAVANVQRMYFGCHSALLVERFDRRFISLSEVNRRHIIDGCQALNLPPEYKYERNFGSGRDVAHIREGASYTKLFDFANQCINPALTKQQILDWALFNTLVFNYDAHGKNISFFISAKGLSLAPFYDLVNIQMYPDFEQEMAMAMGDSFDPNNINAYQLADFADSCDLPRLLVSRRLKFIIAKLKSSLEEIDNVIVKTEEERSYLIKYQKMIRRRCDHLLEQANDIVGMEV
jgi:serine/threonine-protein kinase HipA